MASYRKPTVWINVTTSAAWTRPPVGIVRVERALAAHLQKAMGTEECRLCVWQDDRFVEWVPPSTAPSSDQLEQAVDLMLPRSASFDLARPFVMRALRRFAADSSGPKRQDQVQLAIPTRGSAGLHPQRGDFVISVGLDWDNRYTELFHDLSRREGLRFITCCYDLIPVLFPQYCVGEVAQRFTEYFAQLSWGSEAVLCISEQTRRDYVQLCSELGAPARKTVVIPLGDNIPAQGDNIGMQVDALARKPFILFVSTIERRKNHEVLYRAYHLLARRGLAHKLPPLVFVGMPGWGVSELLKDIELDPLTQGLIVQLNHVSDSELNHLYRHASFCVFPSLYEGWGLPVGEALAMGKAVVASAQGSLPEVGGDLVRYTQPWDVYAWADVLQELIENPDRVREMEARVRKHYQPRQWTETAKIVISLIEELSRTEPPVITWLPGYDLRTHVGVHFGPSLQATGVAGMLAFGPHWTMPPGTYEVSVWGKLDAGTKETVTFDVTSDRGARTHHEEQFRLIGEPDTSPLANLRFTLDREAHAFEIRCEVESRSTLRLDRIEIRNRAQAQSTATATELAAKAA